MSDLEKAIAIARGDTPEGRNWAYLSMKDRDTVELGIRRLSSAGYHLLSDAELAARDNAVLERVEADLRSMLNGEFTSLTIAFNEAHACNYATAQSFHDEYGEYKGDDGDRIEWASEDERLKAILQNSVWTVQWYPNTPVAFNCVGASSLVEAIRALQGGKP